MVEPVGLAEGGGVATAMDTRAASDKRGVRINLFVGGCT